MKNLPPQKKKNSIIQIQVDIRKITSNNKKKIKKKTIYNIYFLHIINMKNNYIYIRRLSERYHMVIR